MGLLRDHGWLPVAALLIGAGMSGFVDGIVFHQVLQWHNMLSGPGYFPVTTMARSKLNMFADGLFHAWMWLFVAAGLAILWRSRRHALKPLATRVFVGWLLIGAGGFDVVEGLIDHQALGVHHVREDSPRRLAWDLGFLAFGAATAAVGLAVLPGRRASAAPGGPS